jgi:serine protease AprX
VGRILGRVGATTLAVLAALVPVVPTTAQTQAAARPPQVRLLGGGDTSDAWKEDIDLGSFWKVNETVKAKEMWSRRDPQGQLAFGNGVGVALIDSGVSPVPGLDAPGQVIDGPDLSLDASDPALRSNDAYGHGTHLASIIAGRDTRAIVNGHVDDHYYAGIAPGAHIIDVKVAAADGAADVSQVIAGIDWVVQHRNDPGLNIRVLNLSFGTESMQSYDVDPLAAAVEAAWRAGIVVVAAAGNDGAAGTTLTNPAFDPYVLAVGAVDHRGTGGRGDDRQATFSSVGNATRRPDVLTPGRSVVGYRVPGSYIDLENPEATVNDEQGVPRLFRGSGTSQAAAVASGAVALMLDLRPWLTPDQIKYLLVANGEPVDGSPVRQIDLHDMHKKPYSAATVQSFPRSTGLGSLELARGGSHLGDADAAVDLIGEYDIFGNPWNPEAWTIQSAGGQAWDGGIWNGARWTGDAWETPTRWAHVDRPQAAFSGTPFDTGNWSGATWEGNSWRGNSWRGNSWRGNSWRGNGWRTETWSGLVWR